VVTQQNYFSPSFMRSAGLLRTACDLATQPVTLLLRRLPAGGSQCHGSGTQVALARALDGQAKPAYEY
jgi:hypothetical protein